MDSIYRFKIEEIIDIPLLEDEDVDFIRFKLRSVKHNESANRNVYYDLPIVMRAVKKNDSLIIISDSTERLFVERDLELYVAHYAYTIAKFSRKRNRDYFCVRGDEMADLMEQREEEEIDIFRKILKHKSG